MNKKDFSKLLERRIDLTRNSLDSKSKEYSSGEDKLHNFYATSAMRRGKPVEECCQGFLDKHLTAYFDMLEAVKNGSLYTQAQIDERFGDIINYFILQEAIFTENYLKQ